MSEKTDKAKKQGQGIQWKDFKLAIVVKVLNSPILKERMPPEIWGNAGAMTLWVIDELKTFLITKDVDPCIFESFAEVERSADVICQRWHSYHSDLMSRLEVIAKECFGKIPEEGGVHPLTDGGFHPLSDGGFEYHVKVKWRAFCFEKLEKFAHSVGKDPFDISVRFIDFDIFELTWKYKTK